MTESDAAARSWIRPWKEAKRNFEKGYVEQVLRHTGGNITRAAAIAEKDRKDFYAVMERCGVPKGFGR